MKSTSILSLLLVCVMRSVSAIDENICRFPTPDPSFTNELYQGLWYEIGKIQTNNDYEKFDVCVTALYSPYSLNGGGGDIEYNARLFTPSGPNTTAAGILEAVGQPGDFKQTLEFNGEVGPVVDYHVIWIDSDSAIEYDCRIDEEGLTRYCNHFMSRTPTLDSAKLAEMISLIEDYDLNPKNVSYEETLQAGCW